MNIFKEFFQNKRKEKKNICGWSRIRAYALLSLSVQFFFTVDYILQKKLEKKLQLFQTVIRKNFGKRKSEKLEKMQMPIKNKVLIKMS